MCDLLMKIVKFGFGYKTLSKTELHIPVDDVERKNYLLSFFLLSFLFQLHIDKEMLNKWEDMRANTNVVWKG